jgi:hypothetical protein
MRPRTRRDGRNYSSLCAIRGGCFGTALPPRQMWPASPDNISTEANRLVHHPPLWTTKLPWFSGSGVRLWLGFGHDLNAADLEPQACPEHLDGVEIKFGIERALNIGGLAKAMLLPGE